MINMNPVERATSLYAQGYNCSQALFISFATDGGIDFEEAALIASGLGGGISLQNSMCGAVIGAIMSLGLSCRGQYNAAIELKKKSREKSFDFMNRFKKSMGSLTCGDLLGYNLSIEKEYNEAQEKALFKNRCSEIVKNAAEILYSIFNRE